MNWQVIASIFSVAGVLSVAAAQLVNGRAARNSSRTADWQGFFDTMLKTTGRIGSQVSDVHDQVTNGGSNLRVELDAFRQEVRAGLTLLHKDVGGIRQELRVERSERIAGDKRRGCDRD